MSADLSVVICSLNGAAGLDRCLHALADQTIRSRLEIIVVDDGSTDNTSDIARAHSVAVVRHVTNRGISAARNSGVKVASAPIVAFLDDDCEPEPQWAEQLLGGYDKGVVGVGGPLVVGGAAGLMLHFLARHNPLDPLELELATSEKLPYRLYLYLRRQWMLPKQRGQRDVFSFASANMSVRREVFIEVGGFDERFRFGSEDEDLCRRLRRRFPTGRLVFMPTAPVVHHFERSLRDTLRRRLAYGRGSAGLYRKWPSVRPTFFPGPIIILAMLASAVYLPVLVVATIVMPHLLYPKGMRAAIADRSIQRLLDAYLMLAQESCDDLGFVIGLWRFRDLASEPSTEAARVAGLRSDPGQTP
jgi:glycosyltransferase involved in cell wall biosynthesis